MIPNRSGKTDRLPDRVCSGLAELIEVIVRSSRRYHHVNRTSRRRRLLHRGANGLAS